jgi:Uncharacterized protein conserved in bacteria (DUF2188)
MSNDKRIHVVPHNGEWATRREGADRVGTTHRTQADQVGYAYTHSDIGCGRAEEWQQFGR